jgi:hypothetical protein
MNGLKKVFADNNQVKGSLNPCILWNLLVTLIQADMPQSKSEFEEIYNKAAPLLEDLNQDKIPDADQAFKELKARHLLRITRKKSSLYLNDDYEEIGSPGFKLKWDLKLIKNTLNYEGMGIRKQEMAICLFCSSDCRSGHNFCEHLRGKAHAQKVVEAWKQHTEMNAESEKNCLVCGISAGKEDWEFEAHLRSNDHRTKLLHFIGMPYCELCNMYLKYGMKMHQNIPLHQDMVRANQAKKKSESSAKQFVSDLDSGNSQLQVNDQFLKLSDPCKGGMTIRTTVGIANEVVLEITAVGERPVDIQDTKIESNTPNNFSIFSTPNNLFPTILYPNESLSFTIRFLAKETGFVRAKIHVRYSNGAQIMRELRYLSLPQITLENLAEELQRSNINTQQLKTELQNEKTNENLYKGYSLEDEEADRELMSRLSFVWDN